MTISDQLLIELLALTILRRILRHRLVGDLPQRQMPGNARALVPESLDETCLIVHHGDKAVLIPTVNRAVRVALELCAALARKTVQVTPVLNEPFVNFSGAEAWSKLLPAESR